MTDRGNTPTWPPAAFAMRMQEAGEEFTERQLELFEQMMNGGQHAETSGLSDLSAMSFGTAMFKTRVQSGGRLSIPDAEREALDIEEGDLVQAFVIPIKRDRSDGTDE